MIQFLKQFYKVMIASLIIVLSLSFSINASAIGGSGTITPLPIKYFTALNDTPHSYVGQAGKAVQVNAGETALEFVGGLAGYVPYTGATQDVDLGLNNLTVDTDTLFVDATNHRVGIGNSSPSARLTVSTSTSNIVGRFEADAVSSNATIRLRSTTSSGNNMHGDIVVVPTSAASDTGYIGLRVPYNAATPPFIVNTAGSVGVGTVTPTYKLEVSAGASDDVFKIASTRNIATQAQMLIYANKGINSANNDRALIVFNHDKNDNSGTMAAAIGSRVFSAGSSTGLGLGFATGSTSSDDMVIDHTGNLGLGNTAPTAKVSIGANISTGVSTTGILLGSDQQSLEYINSQSGSGYGAKLYGVDDGAGVTSLRIATRNNTASWSDRFYVSTSTGRIGIGTTAPTGANSNVLLDVRGHIRASISATVGTYYFSSAATNPYLGYGAITDAWSFSDGNSHKVTITATGRMGIGVTAPTAKLSLTTDGAGDATFLTNGILIRQSNAAAAGEAAVSFQDVFATGTNYWITGLNQSNRYNIAYGNAFSDANTKLSVLSTGEVGIGTVAPTAKLHVVGDIKIAGTGTNIMTLRTGSAGTFDRLDFLANTTNVGSSFQLVPNGTNTKSKIVLSNQNSTSSFSSAFIGVEGANAFFSPQDVSAPTTSVANLYIGSLTGSTLGSGNWSSVIVTNSSLSIQNTSTSVSTTLAHYTGSTAIATNDSSQIFTTLSAAGSYPFNGLGNLVIQPRTSAARDIVFMAGNGTPTVAMNITSTGLVGVGTTSTVNRLNINGINAAAASSGSAANGIIRIIPNGSTAVMDIGMTGSGTHAWIQPRSASSYATNYPLAINPNGGNVGFGTTAPQAKVEISVSAEGAVPAAGTDSTYLMLTNSGVGAYGMMAGVLGTGKGYIQQQRFDGTATTYDLLLNPNGGNVGIGTTTPTAKLYVSGTNDKASIFVNTYTGTSGSHYANIFQNTTTPTGAEVSAQDLIAVNARLYITGTNTFNASSQGRAFYMDAQYQGTQTYGDLRGAFIDIYNTSTGTLTYAYGGVILHRNTGAGTITQAYGMQVRNPINSGGGTFGGFIGFDVNSPSAATGTVYGYRSSVASGATRWNAYFDGTAQNYFAGVVQTGSTIELGHATDTTLSRVSAGVVAIEGVNIVTISSTDTLTNKTLTTPKLTGYTVATLPAGIVGMLAYITDGTVVPAKGVAPVGGGTAKGVVFYDGAAWVGI